jgi:hypothetical protein
MIRLSDNLEINKPAPVDDRLGVFVSTASALTSIAEDRRYVGLTVIVDDGSGAVEYWFKDGVTDNDLEAKSTGGGGAAWGSITGTLSSQTDLQNALDAKVPYTGATANVNLGTYNLTADQLALNVNPTGTLAVGMTEWNNTIGSSQTLLKGGSVTLKNGVDLVARVVNKVNPNTTLTKAQYQVVKVTGAQGQRLAVDLAQGNNDLGSADTIGVVIETIATNQEGFIMTVGQIEGINTTGSLQGETWADGDVLYLSPTTAGRMTNVKPTGLTGHIVVLGYVEYAHSNNGKIYVKIMNGWELDELHNVYINPATLANNDALIYESSTDLWKNKQVTKSMVGLGNVDNTADANKTFTASQITSGTFATARLPKVIPAVAIAGSAVTSGNNTNENIMQTLTIPANTLNVGDVIRIGALNTYTTTGTKAVRVRFGTTTAGTAILSPASLSASVTSTQIDLLAVVTGSTTLRFSTNAIANAVIYGANTGALVNQTIDRTQDISFIVTIQKATGTDTVTCESAFIEIITA